MNEHERMLSILGAVPGIQAVAEKLTEPSEKKYFDFKIHVICSQSGETITDVYTEEKNIRFRVGQNISEICKQIVVLSQWDNKNHYLTVAIDLLSAYRDEVNK